MNTISTLSVHNLKKLKGQYISFGLILMLTSMILNISLVLNLEMDTAYDTAFENYYTADINFCIPKAQDSQKREQVLKKIENLSGVKDVELHEAIYLTPIVKNFHGSDFKMNTMFYNIDEMKDLNEFEIIEEKIEKARRTTANTCQCAKNNNQSSTDIAVYLPLYMSRMGGFKVGDKITYSFDVDTEENDTNNDDDDKIDYKYKISGIIEEMQYGNYGVGYIGAYLTETAFENFQKENEAAAVVEYSIKLYEDTSITEVKNKINEILDDKDVNLIFINDKKTSKQNRTMICNLVTSIMFVFSLIILLVSTFLCKFRVQNTIDEEVTNMGILKAVGYTSNMIIMAQVQPYLLIGILSSILGTVVSYLVLPVISEMLAIQAGFLFKPDFQFIALVVTVLIINLVVSLFTYLAARKIKKLEPINAIRQINPAKKREVNLVPLDKMPGFIKANLILKQTLSSTRQNVLLFFVSFVIMILLSFASVLFYNVNVKPDNFLQAISEESPEVIIETKNEKKKYDSLMKALKKDSDVQKVLAYSTLNVEYDDGSMSALVCEDFSEVTNDICYEGRNPQKLDEIAIGNAFAGNYQIGDKIRIKVDNHSANYVICGFIQSVNNNGIVCELTQMGYKRLNKEAKFYTLNVYLEENIDVKAFIDKYETDYENEIKNTVNYKEMVQNLRRTFTLIITIVIAAIFILTIIIVLLIMYIIIKSLFIKRKQEFGIYKAIGYTSFQLIWQVVLGFFPVTCLASVFSAVLGLYYMPVIDDMIFGMIGIVKNNFEISLSFLLLCALILTVVNLIISLLLSLPIKKISPYLLIKE